MSGGPEFEKVESPLVQQLVGMGWKHNTGSLDHPSVSGRSTFREVVLEAELRDALKCISQGLDDANGGSPQ